MIGKAVRGGRLARRLGSSRKFRSLVRRGGRKVELGLWQRKRNELARRALGWGGSALAGVVLHAISTKLRRSPLAGRSVLVTGGSRGLGLVLARELLFRGAHVAICARDGDELQRAYEDLVSHGGHVMATPADVTQLEQVTQAVDQVVRRFGKLDVLVNNAGVIQVGPMEAMTDDDYTEAMEVHFWGPLHTVQAALPALRAQPGGQIVNISSIGGRIAIPHLLPYSASKFALTGFSRGLRTELAKDGIKVTTIYPGLMRTGSPPNAFFKGDARKEYGWFAASDSLPILSMKAERAAKKICDAIEAGEAEVVLGMPALLAIAFHDRFTEAFYRVAAAVNRMLPGGTSRQRVRGRDTGDAGKPPRFTGPTMRAARRNNELAV